MPERFVSMRAYLKALYKYHLPFLSFPFLSTCRVDQPPASFFVDPGEGVRRCLRRLVDTCRARNAHLLYRAGRDWVVTGPGGRCHTLWLSTEGGVTRRHSSQTRPLTVDHQANSVGESSRTGVVDQRRRCAVACVWKRASVWRIRHADEDCSALHRFVCYRRELLRPTYILTHKGRLAITTQVTAKIKSRLCGTKNKI